MKIIDDIRGYLEPIILILLMCWGSYSLLHIERYVETEIVMKFLKVEFDQWYYKE